MTDNEIIKALECCSTSSAVQCRDCPYCGNNYEKHCAFALANDALDLINRQQAEIERLNSDIITMENVIKNTFLEKAGCDIDPLAEIKAEAIKEFAELIKTNRHKLFFSVKGFDEQIDNLVKEMVGDTE